jgi:hypothetical protein
MPDNLFNMLTPMLALILWTCVMWFWMYATRIPAMRAAKVDVRKPLTRDDLKVLPAKVNWVADNYNHLHEQPTLFYALCTYTHLVGQDDTVNVALAWAYVGLRVVHSLVQATINFIPVRFYLFAAGSLCLMAIAVRDVLALFMTTAPA